MIGVLSAELERIKASDVNRYCVWDVLVLSVLSPAMPPALQDSTLFKLSVSFSHFLSFSQILGTVTWKAFCCISQFSSVSSHGTLALALFSSRKAPCNHDLVFWFLSSTCCWKENTSVLAGGGDSLQHPLSFSPARFLLGYQTCGEKTWEGDEDRARTREEERERAEGSLLHTISKNCQQYRVISVPPWRMIQSRVGILRDLEIA